MYIYIEFLQATTLVFGENSMVDKTQIYLCKIHDFKFIINAQAA